MADTPTVERLQKLLAQYEATAASLRTVIGLLRALPATGRPLGSKNGAHALPPTLRAAVALDTGRRGHVTGGKTGGNNKAQELARRRVTAARLAEYDRDEPRPAKGRGLSPFIAHGYLKKKGDGLVRTAKPFVVDRWADKGKTD